MNKKETMKETGDKAGPKFNVGYWIIWNNKYYKVNYNAFFDYSKCVIFPKGKTSWEGFIPPCKFKDGDVISDSLVTCIFKGEGKIKGTVDYYCGTCAQYFHVKDSKQNPKLHYGYITNFRCATEEEKQKLFQAIKDNGYKWNAETKSLEKLPKFKVGDTITNGKTSITIGYIDNEYYYEISRNIAHRLFIKNQDEWNLISEKFPNKFDITTLKPFDKVLVRGDVGQKWNHDFFGFMDNDKGFPFVCVRHYVIQIIPFVGNEHLLGTTDDCNEYYKTWE